MQCIFLNPEAGDTARYRSIKIDTEDCRDDRQLRALAALAGDLGSVPALLSDSPEIPVTPV